MKKTFLYSLLGIMMLALACDPIEDRDELGPLGKPSDYKFSITQTPGKDYEVTLKNNSPEVLFSWNYAWGVTRRQEATVRMLVPGDYVIKITATTPGGLVFIEHPITVTDADPDAFQEPEWQYLTNFAEGKTWVFDTSLPGAFGNGGFKGCVSPCWWVVDAAGLEGQHVRHDEITFDLNGGRNLTLNAEMYPWPGITKGTFDLDFDDVIDGWSKGKLLTDNVAIPLGQDINQGRKVFYEYYIMKLTEQELHLSASQPGTGDWGEAWFWMFRPKE